MSLVVKYSLADVATPIKDSIRVELPGEAQGTSRDSIHFSLVAEPHRLPLEQYQKAGRK